MFLASCFQCLATFVDSFDSLFPSPFLLISRSVFTSIWGWKREKDAENGWQMDFWVNCFLVAYFTHLLVFVGDTFSGVTPTKPQAFNLKRGHSMPSLSTLHTL